MCNINKEFRKLEIKLLITPKIDLVDAYSCFCRPSINNKHDTQIKYSTTESRI